MADATTVLARLDKLEPPNDKGWIILNFKGASGPLTVSTKYADKCDGLKVGSAYEVTYTTTQNGQYVNHFLSKIAPAPEKSMPPAPMEASEQPIPMPPSQAEVFEARDRRIAMEAAYHAASRVLQGSLIPDPGTQATFQAWARAIYRDIIAAGQGDTFEDGLREDEELPL